MSVINIIKTNYTKTFDFKGRQGIQEYWTFFLFFILVFFLLIFLVLGKDFVYFSIIFPFIIIPFLSATARRLHNGETSNKKTYYHELHQGHRRPKRHHERRRPEHHQGHRRPKHHGLPDLMTDRSKYVKAE